MSVDADGYAWWYVDGISDDGDRAVSVIGFIGSVFSPYYRWMGRRDPLNHSSINVALYGRGGRWAMTERGRGAVRRSPERFEVGPSSMEWEGGALTIRIDEIAVPHLTRLRGTIRVIPSAVTEIEASLDPAGAHVWRPFAPVSRIEVDIDRNGWRWDGHGYFDANFGTRALEDDFSYWTWSRLPTRDGAATFYDAARRDGSHLEVALRFGPDGSAEHLDAPPRAKMKRTLWQVRRETRADAGFTPHQVRPMLDAPFYSRSMVRTKVNGEESTGVHEALDLDRFANPLLKFMLPVRMPRRSGWTWK